MTDKQFYMIYSETPNYANPDSFASDVALSSLNPDDPEQEVYMAFADQLRTLWHVANDSFKALLERMGLNQTQCATRFCIPLRTVQDWASGKSSASPYIRLMMAELTGLVRLHE